MNCILTRQEYDLSLFYPKEGKRTRIYLKKNDKFNINAEWYF
jgi:hypothetical protein